MCRRVRATFPSPYLLSLSPPSLVGQFQEEFLKGRIKVSGKTGNLGDDITLNREKNVISVVSGIPLSKR